MKTFAGELINKATAYTGAKLLYQYQPVSNDGAVYYYVKLVVKIPTDKVAGYTAYIKSNASDISSISVEKIAVDTELTDVHFSKIDIELNAGSSSSGSDSTNIVIYVFLGLIVAKIAFFLQTSKKYLIIFCAHARTRRKKGVCVRIFASQRVLLQCWHIKQKGILLA